jgi:hypothetical protein
MVSIEKYINDSEDVGKHGINPDWIALIDVIDQIDTEKYERYKARGKDYPPKEFVAECPTLKPEVLAWLHENIKPPKSPADLKEDQWGWAMGNPSYRIRGMIGLNLWFYRRSDAMAFIRTWSVYKKPTSYFNYFSGYRWTLGKNGKIKKGK